MEFFMNILGIGAHPDDLELLCGGTLALYARQGHDVTMAVLTNGNLGHPEVEPEEMGRVRRAEFEAAAALIGADTIWMGVDDELSVADLETRLKMVDVLRRANPDVILTHNPDDYHVDHRVAGQLAFEAAPLACVYNLKTKYPSISKQALIYYFDTLGAVNFLPTEYVDISETVDIKKRMIRCHTSQGEWMKTATGFDMEDVIEHVARVRGFAAGVPYAEGFRRLEAWFRGTVKRVLP
jgi:LmbE family N-acetylglucosaminyl deacetylase